MSKDQLTRLVQKELKGDFSLPQVNNIVETVLKSMTAIIAADQELFIKNFGKFKVKIKPAHTARNPRTGEEVKVAEYKRVTFTYGKAFKELVNPKKSVSVSKKKPSKKK